MSEQEKTKPTLTPEGFTQWVAATLSLIEADAAGQHTTSCPEWWKHPEAVARLKALYAAYVKSAADGDLSSWWVHHWDAHARMLFSPETGVFRDCGLSHQEHKERVIRTEVVYPAGDELEQAVGDAAPWWI